jgi:hypothetical protein
MENFDSIINEKDLINLVGASLKKNKYNQQMMVICSKDCKDATDKFEWFLVPFEINHISVKEMEISLGHIQSDYDARFMIFRGRPLAYYYLIKFDVVNQLIFEYGRKSSPDLSDFVNQIQPALILKNALLFPHHIDSFIIEIFENLHNYPANKESMD